MRKARTFGAQAALDFMISYGVAILVLSISIYTIFQLGIFNAHLAPQYCNAVPSFICAGYAMNTSGSLTLLLTQTTGGTVNITGAGCSDTANAIGNWPAHGNVNLEGYSAVPQYYPNNAMQYGLLAASSNTVVLNLNCYAGSGKATGAFGNNFVGSVWINFTYSNLPATAHNVQRIITFSAKYS